MNIFFKKKNNANFTGSAQKDALRINKNVVLSSTKTKTPVVIALISFNRATRTVYLVRARNERDRSTKYMKKYTT